ncbi:MAG TPA: branched-chain amino acid ABC transporter ATP-binding protein/permease [Stellaceae bacterium]|nr:branched-chain amino acid ABC transporter ATP-binding protein/permease [Stellaceae bacterium]
MKRGSDAGRGALAPLLAAGALGLALYALLFASPYAIRLLTLAGIDALLVIGYQLIFGHAGALSLAQGAFFGLGAYVTGILGSAAGLGFLVTFPLSLLLPAALAALVAVPTLRLQSHYFALATLGIGQVLLLGARNWDAVTGGANGLAGVPGVIVLGIAVPAGLPLLALIWAMVALGGALARHVVRGPLELAFLLLRESPLGAAAIGLDGGRLRLLAFVASASYAGAAGALGAHALRVVSPDVLGFPVMVTCLAMTVIGGRLRVAGAVLGALLLVSIPEWTRFLEGAYLLAYGLALLAIIILMPEGVIGVLERAGAVSRSERPLPPVRSRPPPQPAKAACSECRLDIRGLAKRYGGVEALAGVDLALKSGEILGLIGPNGSGKTTLVNLVTGVDAADAGAILLDGAAIAGLPAHGIARRGIARSFQAGALSPSMSVLDTVALARQAAERRLTLGRALVAGHGRRAFEAARGEAMHLLESMKIGDIADRRCGELAAGLRRRVEIARALALRPRFLLLDEPAAGLVTEERRRVADDLAALASEGLGLLVVEHDMPFLMPLAHRIVCLDRGRVIASGTPAEIARDPRVVAAYLGTAAPAAG